MQRDCIHGSQKHGEANSAYARLKQLVLNQALRPNEQLSVRVLAIRFSTSTTKVREALIRLAAEGFIEHLPNGGFFTRPLVQHELQHAYDLAFILLKQSVESYMRQPDLCRISRFAGLLENCNNDVSSTLNDPITAHVILLENSYREMARLSGNSWIARVIEQFTVTTSYVRLLDLTEQPRNQETAQHIRELIDCLKRHRSEDAVAKLRFHFTKTVERLSDLVKEANARALHARPLDSY